MTTEVDSMVRFVRRSRPFVTILLGITAVAFTLQTAPTWTTATAANPGKGFDHLLAVDAISASDVWAVGNYSTNNIRTLTLAEHWDGSAWAAVATPNPALHSADCSLNSVSATSAVDVWAVGWCAESSNVLIKATLIEHWDGTSWSVVASPTTKYLDCQLSGVTAISPTDAWAVGSQEVAGNQVTTLAEHWDGTSWTEVPISSGGASSELFAVSASASTDVWAVGSEMTDQGWVGLAVHWDGARWTSAPIPAVAGFEQLLAVSAASSADVWAVGYSSENGASPEAGVILHWNGADWSDVSTSVLPQQDTRLFGVSATSGGVWVVGSYFTGQINHYNEPANRTVAVGESAGIWTTATTGNPSTLDDVLYGVAITPSGDAWAVGTAFSPALVEHTASAP